MDAKNTATATKVRIPVKIGSNTKVILVQDKQMCCDEFIRKVLVECKMEKAAECFSNTYALFEVALGINRMVGSNENMFVLWEKVENCKKSFDIKLAVKKYRKTSSRKKYLKNSKRSGKTFKRKARKAKSLNTAIYVKSDKNIFADINDNDVITTTTATTTTATTTTKSRISKLLNCFKHGSNGERNQIDGLKTNEDKFLFSVKKMHFKQFLNKKRTFLLKLRKTIGHLDN